MSSIEGNLRGEIDQIKLIGSGGMSQVFRARQPALDRYVAVKRLKDELLENAEARERFRREARALASVLHQNIAHVYDYVEGPRESFLLMEFIDGVDLSTIIGKVGPMPAEIAAAILLGVAKGVSYIHSQQLIHRDIKPSNIRINTRGEVKLMDFGIVIDNENHSITRPGMMVGSPSYLSPEQVLGDAITPKADTFLLGICLYEMLTGTKPFEDTSRETVFQRIREAKYVPIKERLPGLPGALAHIVGRCLEKYPGRRYDSVRNVSYELEEFLGPTVSAHAEGVILKFLDNEALLKASVSQTALVEFAQPYRRPRWMGWVVGAILCGFCLWGGYRWGAEAGSQAQQKVQERFPPPKSLPTKRP